jgi:hypothetical protein
VFAGRIHPIHTQFVYGNWRSAHLEKELAPRVRNRLVYLKQKHAALVFHDHFAVAAQNNALMEPGVQLVHIGYLLLIVSHTVCDTIQAGKDN